MEYYKKKYITCKEDAPKDDEYYFVGIYGGAKAVASYDSKNEWWDELGRDNVFKFIDVDWYLIPCNV